MLDAILGIIGNVRDDELAVLGLAEANEEGGEALAREDFVDGIAANERRDESRGEDKKGRGMQMRSRE